MTKNHKNPTQKDRVLKMLRKAGKKGVSSSQFYADYLPRFGARIYELRSEGYKIDARPDGVSSSGNRLFRYTLKK